mgnify:CR=1 FL=1
MFTLCCIWPGNGSSSGDDEEQSGDDEEQPILADDDHAMVVADDDLAMVVADDDLAMVAAPAIPQLGDRTMPIVVEEYIRVGIRHSERIRLMKEKKEE